MSNLANTKIKSRDQCQAELIVDNYLRTKTEVNLPFALKHIIFAHFFVPLVISIGFEISEQAKQRVRAMSIVNGIRAMHFQCEPISLHIQTVPIFVITINKKFMTKFVIAMIQSNSEAEAVSQNLPPGLSVIFWMPSGFLQMSTSELQIYYTLFHIESIHCQPDRFDQQISKYLINLLHSCKNEITRNNQDMWLSLPETQIFSRTQNARRLLYNCLIILQASVECACILTFKYQSLAGLMKAYEDQHCIDKTLLLYFLSQNCTNLQWKTAWGNVKYPDVIIQSFETADQQNIVLDIADRPTIEFSKNTFLWLFGTINV